MTMRPRMNFLGSCLALATSAAVLLYGGTAVAAELSVCIDTSSPMAAVDAHLAQAVAARQGAVLRVHNYSSDENDDVNGMAGFDELAHECELVLDFPLDTDAGNVDLGGLHITRPYAHTRFVLVTPQHNKATTLAELPRGSSVAITYMTPPNLYLADHPDLQPVVTIHNKAAFNDLTAGTVTAAMIWYPAVVGYLKEHPAADLAVHALHEPHARFNLVAMYESSNAPVAARFEQAISAMQASGALQEILGNYAEAGPTGSAHAGSTTMPPRSAGVNRPRSSRVASTCSSGHPSTAAGPSQASASPALYTAEQATSGKQKFLDNCSVCHGADLGGNVGPALKGKHFAPPSSNYHVSDIFTIVTHNMPATQPGSLPHQDYVEIMAFLLQQNGYPAGNQALTYDEAMQSKTQFLSK